MCKKFFCHLLKDQIHKRETLKMMSGKFYSRATKRGMATKMERIFLEKVYFEAVPDNSALEAMHLLFEISSRLLYAISSIYLLARDTFAIHEGNAINFKRCPLPIQLWDEPMTGKINCTKFGIMLSKKENGCDWLKNFTEKRLRIFYH